MTPSSHRSHGRLQNLIKRGGKKRGPEWGGNCDRTLVVTVMATAEATWPFRVTGLGERKHVAVSGSPLQLRSTFPVKPNSGVTLTTYLADCPAEMLRVDGMMETAKSTPLPARVTIWGLPPALSVIVRAPPTVPTAAGVNVTLIVQLALAGRGLVQLLV